MTQQSDGGDAWIAPPLDIEKTSYSVAEFLEWQAAGRLTLSPEFQRGQVWSTPAKAFLIDTILRGYPIPPVHIRHVQRGREGLTREVIDGQQRISAVLQFARNELRLSRPRIAQELLPPWAGLRFEDLDPYLQERFNAYSFRCEVYKGNIDDSVIYEIFSRINTYSVPLSDQELRNGRFFGEFKSSVYGLASEMTPFWRASGIFTPQAIARMVDREFISEALALQMRGMQDKKTSLNSIYAEFDQEWVDRTEHENRFRRCIDEIRGSVGELIPDTRFKRPALFYTLYATVYHRIYGLSQRLPEGENPLPSSPESGLGEQGAARLRDAMLRINEAIAGDVAYEEGPIASFVAAAARQTDNIRPRLTRLRSLWALADLSRS